MRDFSKISPKFFTGEVGVAIRGDADAYAVAFYVMAGPMVNSIGLYRLPIGTLADELGIPRARVEQGLARLIEAGLVKYDERTMHIWIVDYMRHQWTGVSALQRKGIESELMEHRISSVFNDFLACYGKKYGLTINPSERVGQPITKPMANTRDQRPETRDQRPEETKTAEPAEPASAESEPRKRKTLRTREQVYADPEFVEFWKIYPKNVAKGDAAKAWAQTDPDYANGEFIKRPDDIGIVLSAVAERSKSHDWLKDGGQFVPNPATWIRAAGWEDKVQPGYGKPLPRERRFQPRDTKTKYPQPDVFE